jgi:hypothetical protein
VIDTLKIKMRLYYHKTDGEAEYLTDTYVLCDYCDKCDAETPNDGSEHCDICGSTKHKEGVFEGAKYIVRIDGDIEIDAELNVKEEKWLEAIENCEICKISLCEKHNN